ncbi:MAG: hypothetical protein HOH27_06630 [Acidimicrobiaceae bacterium]|nr:hypothetical protein [Acidimicrobiaceae bacterium]
MIKYLGSKRRLVPVLDALCVASGATTALDLFTGTTRVAQAFKQRGLTVTAVDSARYAHLFAECYVAIDAGEVDADDLADALAHLQDALDPEAVLGAVRSPEQEALLPRLEALVAVVVGVVDHVMDTVGTGLIGSYGQVTEALRRRRVTTSDADRFVERILGLNLTQEQVDRGSAFVTGVVERAGEDGLALLWTEARNLPTPSEVDAPGLWLARLELPDTPSDD